jgi:methionyl-tRNA synthetase
MPDTSDAILCQLCEEEMRDYEDLDKFGLYESGKKVTAEPEILFARLNPDDIMKRVEEIRAAQKAEYEKENGITAEEAESAEKENDDSVIDIDPKETITYDDFSKLQLQVGEIIACEAVPKSKKLLCSKVKIGSCVRQILSGIKTSYSPEEMVGKKVMVLVNLQPREIAGLMSEGMILCAEDAEGKLAIMVPDRDMPAGAEIC